MIVSNGQIISNNSYSKANLHADVMTVDDNGGIPMPPETTTEMTIELNKSVVTEIESFGCSSSKVAHIHLHVTNIAIISKSVLKSIGTVAKLPKYNFSLGKAVAVTGSNAYIEGTCVVNVDGSINLLFNTEVPAGSNCYAEIDYTI